MTEHVEGNGVSMGVLSWNTNRVNFERLRENIMPDLVCELGRKVLMLQEVGSWPEDPAKEGWHILHAEFSAAALAVPLMYGEQIWWRGSSDCTCSVLLGPVGIMSGYLADSGKSMEAYEHTILEWKSQRVKLRAAGAKQFIVGSDAQVELPPNF